MRECCVGREPLRAGSILAEAQLHSSLNGRGGGGGLGGRSHFAAAMAPQGCSPGVGVVLVPCVLSSLPPMPKLQKATPPSLRSPCGLRAVCSTAMGLWKGQALSAAPCRLGPLLPLPAKWRVLPDRKASCRQGR